MSFALARKIADAVLYEGYVLYPYRPSSAKNRFRWQFGVVAPRAWSENGGDPWEMQTECLIEPDGAPEVDIAVRFLQVQPSEAAASAAWEEGVERTIEIHAAIDDLNASVCETPITVADGSITGVIRLSADQHGRWIRLRVRIENLTPLTEAHVMQRGSAMRHSLIGTHTLLSITGGNFVSLMDPLPDAAAAAESCANLHTWPVLVGGPGTRHTLLSSPIILQDYPVIAPESEGDFFDATEIDELLTLRVITLTDAEKREACAADPHARRVIERCDAIPGEYLARLHGAIRSIEPSHVENFFNPPDELPETQSIEVAGAHVSRGSRVRLAPRRNADSMDLFLAGRTARVESIHHDIEDRVYVAVTVESDPAAADGDYRRYFYFHPDELELVGKEE